MTYDPLAMVIAFHDKFHADGEARNNSDLNIEKIVRRSRLINEEAFEVDEAVISLMAAVEFGPPTDIEYNKAQVAKELADLLYVIYGTADELGIPIYDVFAAVHASNMSKVWDDGEVHYNEYGKVLKPDSYVAPDILAIMNTWNTQTAQDAN